MIVPTLAAITSSFDSWPRVYLRLRSVLLLVLVGMLPLTVNWSTVIAAGGIEFRSDLIYREIDGQKLALDAYLPAGGGSHRAAVLVIHGGGWWSGDKADANRKFMSQQLAQQGFVAIAVNYRLVPKDVYPAAIEDLEAAVAWLRQPAQSSALGVDPARIGVLGASSGAQLAGLLGSIGKGPLTQGSRVTAVVSFSGPMSFTGDLASAGGATSVLNFLGCKDAKACPNLAAASPITYVDPSDPPYLLVNASGDRTVWSNQAELMSAALDKAGVVNQMLIEPGNAHGTDLYRMPPVATATMTFLHTYLDAK